ncbi:hypothetical protein ACP70R_003977 [Stipagrostis hirtigluma subsp. patula]
MDPIPPSADELQKQMGNQEPSMEKLFEGEPVPSRAETLTARSVAVSVVLGVTMSAVGMKLNLVAGYLSSLAIPAVLLGFVLPPVWVRVNDLLEMAHVPFTRQENTVIQTFVFACSNIAYTGGFGSHIVAMSKSNGVPGLWNSGRNLEEPHAGQLVAFLFLTCFAGLFAILPFRNSLIIRQHLTFPSGAAAARLINSIHIPHGAKQASKKVTVLVKTFIGTISWLVFRWFFASGPGCGFEVFPTFGLTAFRLGFYYDFSVGIVGAGMLSSNKTTISMLAGSLVSWGIIWPYIDAKKGSWYPEVATNNYNLSGLYAYRVFIGISMILADSIFHLLQTLYAMYNQRQTQQQREQAALPFHPLAFNHWTTMQCFDEWRREQVFLCDRIFNLPIVIGYIVLSAISIVAIPQLYPQLSCHHVAFVYLILPVFAFCNTYTGGISDLNMATTYVKVTMLIIGSWVGLDQGGVIAVLAAGSIILSSISTAFDLMQNFRTGYITLTSPHTVLISHVAGTMLGCMINPALFWVLFHVYNDDNIAPYAKMYRGIAMLSMSRHQKLPKHSVLLAVIFFALALVVSVLREVSTRRRWRVSKYIPSTIAVAVGFLLSPTMPIGMFMGSMVMYIWRRLDSNGVRLLSPMVAAGLICGDGFGSLLMMAPVMFKVRAPICLTFVARDVNKRLDAFLATVPLS